MNSSNLVELGFELPDLTTVVGLFGHVAREEVAGPGCLAVMVGTIVGG